MTTPHLPKTASALACLVAACSSPQADPSSGPVNGYRVVVTIDRPNDAVNDGLEQHVLDVDVAGTLRRTKLVTDDDSLELAHARPIASPDGRWLFVDRGVEHDSLGYFLYDLHALGDAETVEGERLALEPRDGSSDATATFSADSSVLAVVADDGVRMVSLADVEHPSDALDLADEEVYDVFARPASAELVIETQDSLWWHHGNADDTRVRKLLVEPEPIEDSPFLDADTLYYSTGDTWAMGRVIDGVLQGVEEIELISEDDPTEPCRDFQPLAEGATVGGVCFGLSPPYWVDAHSDELPWSFQNEQVRGGSTFALTPGGRYLAYAAREEIEQDELDIRVVDLAKYGDAIRVGSVPADALSFGTCFDETYVIVAGVLHRIDDIGGDAPDLVEVGTFAWQDTVEWYCMPGDAAAVLVTGRSVSVVHADDPDVLDTRVTVDPDREVRGVGPGDATRFVYRETCLDGNHCDTQVGQLSIDGGDLTELIAARVVDRPLVLPR
jgi:hypothetical protein